MTLVISAYLNIVENKNSMMIDGNSLDYFSKAADIDEGGAYK
jgi:hypothetical protein